MGSYFTFGASRRDIIRECVTGWENDGVTTECKAHCAIGNVLWSVWERTFPVAMDRAPETWIKVDLLQKQHNFGWGYKSMEESMHPYYYSCPPKYLAMATSGICQEWRETVKVYWERRKRRRAERREAKRFPSIIADR